MVRKFQWNEISEAVLFTLSDFGDRGEYLADDGYSSMELLLLVADGLDPGAALDALVQLSADRVEKEEANELFLSNYIRLLWKGAIRCGTDIAFHAIAKKLENAEPDFLGPSIDNLTQYVKDHGDRDNKFDTLLPSIVGKRIEWLKTRIEALEKPFSWEMPDAKLPTKDDLPEKEKMLEFLRSSEVSMQAQETKAFKTVQDANNFVAAWMREEQVDCSFEMEVITTDVTITKTRDMFLKQQNQLMK